MLVRILVFCVLLITCKDSNSFLKLTEEEIKEIQKQNAGADTDMFIDSELNLILRVSHFLPAEPGEIIGATVELESYANIELGEPDTNGISSPTPGTGELPVGKWLRVDLKNHDGQLCKVVIGDTIHSGIVYQLQKPEEKHKGAYLYHAKDRICIDDKIVPMRALSAVMGSYGIGGLLPDKKLQERVAAYKERQKEFLETDADRIDVQEFMLRAKMLDGHFALREKLSEGQEGTLISSVLGAFVSDSHNVMPSEEILQNDDSLALQMTKVAVAGTVSRFLMYQQVFNAAEFSVDKFNDDFDRIEWHADLAPVAESVKNNYTSDTEGMTTFSNISDLKTALEYRIAYMNIYLREKIAETGECETHLEDLYQGLHHPETYYETLAKKDKGLTPESFESKLGDVEGMLLLTTDGLTTTKLYQACDRFSKGLSLVSISKDDDVRKIVESVKKNVLKTLKDLNNKYKKDVRKDNYLPDLIAGHMFALPPVLTFSDSDVSEVVMPLVDANTKMTKKENRDQFWSRFTGIVTWVTGALGIIAVIAFLITPFVPPAAAIASLAAVLSLAGTAILVPTYTVEWFQERSDYRSLESNILAGGSQEYGEQIEHLSEFRSARNDAFLNGAGLALAAVPVTRFVRTPRTLIPKSPKEMVKGIWGASKRPFTWAGKAGGAAWTTVRHPVQSAKNFPSAANKMWTNIRQSIRNMKDKVMRINKKTVTGAAAVTAKQGITASLKNSVRRIGTWTIDVWRINIAVLKNNSAWRTVQNVRKANKGVLGKTMFRMTPYSSRSVSTTVEVTKLGNASKQQIRQIFRQHNIQPTFAPGL